MSKLKMTMTKMATLMYMIRMMMMMTMAMTVTLIILMAARRTVMMMMIVMMKVLRVAVTGTKATIAKKLYVKVDPNSKIKLKFMLESSRALML